MGRIVRRFGRFFELEMRGNLEQGSEAVPRAQYEAGQVLHSAVINATALGGTVESGIYFVVASVNLTGILKGLRAGVTVNDGITVTPTGGAHTDAVFGAEIEVDILGTGIVAGRTEGLRIEMSSALGSETQSAFNGIFVSNYNLGTQSAQNYYMLRMQENGTYVVHCMFYLRGGIGGVTYFAVLHGDTDAWAALGAPTTQMGWIRLLAGGTIRYIRLYRDAP